VTAHLTSPKARRVEAQHRFGRLLERAIHEAGLTVSAFAERFGFRREKLYPIFRGEARLHAGALWALPVEVRRRIVEDLAKSCDLEVRPLSDAPGDALHAAIVECADVTREAALALADGRLDPQEASRVRAEAMEAMESLASVVAQCDEVLATRVPRAVGRVS